MEATTSLTRRVLVISRDTANSRAIADATEPWMFETVVCCSLQESRELLNKEDFVLIFCQDHLEDGAYPEVLSMVQPPQKVPVVVMLSDPVPDFDFREVRKLGAMDVLRSPCSRKDIQWMVIRATQHGALSRGRH